jgi:hypothetical protein
MSGLPHFAAAGAADYEMALHARATHGRNERFGVTRGKMNALITAS